MLQSLAVAALSTSTFALAGSWQPLAHQPALPDILDPTNDNAYLGPGGVGAPMLLTDGSVLVRNTDWRGYADGTAWKLTPDSNGSYVGGTWSQVASLPYIPVYPAQAVLADGRVLVEGGEYSGVHSDFTLTNEGAIYDPVADAWTPVQPPAFFEDLYPPRATFAPNPIGDSASVVLPDGTFMLADKMSRQAALLDPATLLWAEVGTGTKADLNDEEGLTLLPNGNVLTVDCYTDYYFGLVPEYPADPTNSEIYDSYTQQWSSAGSTIESLTDPVLYEIGPAVLRPDGTVFAVGSQGNSSIYHTSDGSWTQGPTLPISPQGHQYTVQDGPGALLPNGNVLIAASGGAPNPSYSDPPVAFFEFDGAQFVAQPAIPNASFLAAYSISLLVLPTGQILEADGTDDVEIYTPEDPSYDPAWAPVIGAGPAQVIPGGSYRLYGIRFNGMSQASVFGDETQNATNYPLVRITNIASGHVFYARTHDHTSMAVASSAPMSTLFDVAAGQELGPSTLEVVANGIPSAPLMIDVVSDALFANGFEPMP